MPSEWKNSRVLLAMGAAAVLVGRPLLWALAVEGPAGVTGLLRQLRDDLAMSMALSGAATIGELDSDLIA